MSTRIHRQVRENTDTRSQYDDDPDHTADGGDWSDELEFASTDTERVTQKSHTSRRRSDHGNKSTARGEFTQTENLEHAVASGIGAQANPKQISIAWWLWLWYWLFGGSTGIPLEPFFNRRANGGGLNRNSSDFADTFLFNYFRGCSALTYLMLLLWFFWIVLTMYIVTYLPSTRTTTYAYRPNENIVVPTLAYAPAPALPTIAGAITTTVPVPNVPLGVPPGAAPPLFAQGIPLGRNAIIPANAGAVSLSVCTPTTNCADSVHYAFVTEAASNANPRLSGVRILGSLCAATCTANPPAAAGMGVLPGTMTCVCTIMPDIASLANIV